MAGPHPHTCEHRVAEAGVVLVMLFWAANFIVVKAAIHQIPR